VGKICKGTGNAIGYGCGNQLEFSERNGIKTYFKNRGLCTSGNRCYSNWLIKSDYGKDLITKVSLSASNQNRKKIIKVYAEEKKDRKWELMSTVQKINKARPIFQKWIRNRDKDSPCISCRTSFSDEWAGGHYLKAELYTGVIFNELNVNKQCLKCNKYLGGNEAKYRIALVELYGEQKIEELESIANQTKTYRYTDDELKSIMKQYKLK